MSYIFTPSVTAALTVARRPDPAPVATAGIHPDVPAELFTPSLERRAGLPFSGPSGSNGLGRAIRAVAIGILAAELDRAFVRKSKGKRLDDRYGAIAALAAIIGLEI